MVGDGRRAHGFLSTLPARGATSAFQLFLCDPLGISIHAPREGSDTQPSGRPCMRDYFYPRSPRGERLLLPAHRQGRTGHFYPRSPRGERPGITFGKGGYLISIHAPREGSDCISGWTSAATAHFYPRSPRGERPQLPADQVELVAISIHAPREGSDPMDALSRLRARISIHAPREGSDKGQLVIFHLAVISIHAPREGSDGARAQGHRLNLSISIHAPREGSDRQRRADRRHPDNFYPRSPRGERPTAHPSCRQTRYFYPRSPRGERPAPPSLPLGAVSFLSTLPARGATAGSVRSMLYTC